MTRRRALVLAVLAALAAGMVVLWLQRVRDGSNETAALVAGGLLWVFRMAGLMYLARWWWRTFIRRREEDDDGDHR